MEEVASDPSTALPSKLGINGINEWREMKRRRGVRLNLTPIVTDKKFKRTGKTEERLWRLVLGATRRPAVDLDTLSPASETLEDA